MKQLSEEQLANIRSAFQLFDKDNNGIVTATELGSVFNCIGITVSPEQLQEMLLDVDKNGTGKVEFDDFCQMMQERKVEFGESDMRKAFRVFDLDGNGFIDHKELQTVLGNKGLQLSDEVVQKMIAKADRDGDGMLNFVEFSTQLQDISLLTKEVSQAKIE